MGKFKLKLEIGCMFVKTAEHPKTNKQVPFTTTATWLNLVRPQVILSVIRNSLDISKDK